MKDLKTVQFFGETNKTISLEGFEDFPGLGQC